jgi:2-dehydro-3-deoxy-D-gluconate 5-dehydrogenase
MLSTDIQSLFDLTEHAAIVTGGAMGIGKAIAKRLSEAGASVVITDIDRTSAENTALELDPTGDRVVALAADAGSAEDAKRVSAFAMDKFGTLDILVNNAGIFSMIPFTDITEEVYDNTLQVNTKGVFFYCQAFSRELIKHGKKGKIINITSKDAIHPTGALAHYNTSKGGVAMMTKALALELGPHNICVNAVAPGFILTEGVERLFGMGMPKEDLVEIMPKGPLGRVGVPEDIANVVLFLAGGASDFLTGTMIVADGGILLT